MTTLKTTKRYKKNDLDEFRAIINKKLDKAKKEYDLIKGSFSKTDDHGTDDTSPTFKVLEEGSEVLSKEENAQLASRQKKFIDHLELAIVRIENGTYGVCRKTGKLISKERLKAVPHATLSIEAKQSQSA